MSRFDIEFAEFEKMNAANLAKNAIRDMLIEFLRAISANDISGRDHKVSDGFWRALKHLGDMDGESCRPLVTEAFREAIVLAGLRDRDTEYPAGHEYFHHFQEAITASAKVLAERISGVSTQETRAESAAAEHMNAREKALRALRSKYGIAS